MNIINRHFANVERHKPVGQAETVATNQTCSYVVFWRRAKPASLYLLPYLAWVSFAAFLNLTVVRLNAPFV